MQIKEEQFNEFFEVLWNCYGLKKNKHLAKKTLKKNLKEFANYCKKVQMSSVDLIKKWKNQEQQESFAGKSLPHFSTWLSRKRWEEVEAVKPVKKVTLAEIERKLAANKKLQEKVFEYKSHVSISIVNIHKKNILEKNAHAERSKKFLEQRGIAL
jgi:hypothetical protein